MGTELGVRSVEAPSVKSWSEKARSEALAGVALSSGARWLMLAAFAFVPGAAMLHPTQAWAQCVPATGSNITVTCSGSTVNQGPGSNTGYGDSTQNGLTVNVQSGASLLGTSTGIDVNNNNTINNLGTISTNGSGGSGNVFGINDNGPLTLNNSGTIGRIDLNNPANTDSAGVFEGGSLLLTNNSGGVIQGSIAVEAAGTPNTMTVTNFGLISGIVGGGGMGISGDSLTVTNNASGTITGDASGINANSATVVNYGTISAPTFGGVAVNANTLTLTNYASGTITGDGGAISGSSTPNLTITNFGAISGGIDAGISGAISGNVVNLTNSGTISIATGSGGPAISMVSGGVTNNAGGSITGDFEAIATSGNTTIFNAGTISANSGPAIFFQSLGGGGTGGNTLTIAPTSVINGNVIGAGSDTFQLGGSGAGAFNLANIGTQYTGFTTYNVASGTWTVTGTFAPANPWTVESGTLEITGSLGNASGVLLSGGTIVIGNNNALGAGTLSMAAGTTLAFLNTGNFTVANNIQISGDPNFVPPSGTTQTVSGMISDGSSPGVLDMQGPGTLVLSGINAYSGGTVISGGILTFSGVGTVGAASGSTTINTGGTLDLGGTTQTQAAVNLAGGTLQNGALNAPISTTGGIISNIGGTASVTAIAGSTIVEGTDSYTGATAVNGGILDVIGSITGTSGLNVGSGGTLTGTGTIDPPTVTIGPGATFVPGTAGVPGTSMTIAGNLAFQSGALYVVAVNQAASSFANVTGTAALGGTVQATFSPGISMAPRYTILQSAGLNGTTFAGLTTSNAPANFTETLSYSADDVFLNLNAALGQGSALSQNQQSVATTINNVFNSGATLSPGFVNVFGLSGSGLSHALTQLDGEDATGAAHSAFILMNDFLGLMLDPFVYGRGGAASGGGALGFAPDQPASFPPDVALAYAGLLKAPARQNVDQRWTVWGAGFGGTGTANGDPNVGSNTLTASTYGFAAGADYHVSADTVLGFAAAGSGTNWSLAQSLGSGRSDAFQAGVYGTRYFGPAYIGASLAFTNNWFTTNRIAAAGDQLTASFTGQSFGARVESGYRYAVAPAAGVTPYAAIQAQNFHTPTYSETDLTGGGFGLTYNAMTATDTRSELGARFDALTAWGAMPVQLRARLAWAHDWVSNPALDAAFQALPGSSFVVKGAAVPQNSALTSLGAELHLTPRWTLIGKFDGEFASSAQTYAGSGTLRYTW